MATFILGLAIGLIASPIIRSWIVWREYRAASRAAWLASETLRRLEDQPIESGDRDARWR